MTTGRRNARGFTLLELLIAMSIMAVLAGSLYATLRVAFTARRSALASTEMVRKMNLAMDLIRADLQSAVIPNGILAQGFVGTDPESWGSGGNTLTFCTSAMDIEPSPGIGDIKEVEYSCEPEAGTGEMVLMRRVTTNLLAEIVPEPRQEIICRGVRSFSLQYYDGTTWLPSWDSSGLGNVLPQAVEVTLELENGNGATSTTTATRIMMPACGQGAATTTSPGGTQ